MTHGLMKLIPTLALASILIGACSPSAPPPAATAAPAKIALASMPKLTRRSCSGIFGNWRPTSSKGGSLARLVKNARSST